MFRYNRTEQTTRHLENLDFRGMYLLHVAAQTLLRFFKDAYMIQRYGQLAPTLAKVKRTYMRKAMPECKNSSAA